MSTLDNDIVIHPFKTRKDPEIPPTGILFVNPGEAGTALADVVGQGGKRYYLHNSQLAIAENQLKFIAGPAVSAPVAALVMEKLIVLGAQRIILMGWCGAVDKGFGIGDIVIPTEAVTGEGTSQYYSNIRKPRPAKALVERLQMLCNMKKMSWKSGTIWSTDAPYRESRKYLTQLNNDDQVVGVDMEFSALCSVASYRHIEFAAIMIVSDEIWGKKWAPGFKNPVFKERCKMIVDYLLEEKL